MTTELEQEDAAIERALAILSEHFDAAQILVSRYSPENEGTTSNQFAGFGNWMTRRGLIYDFMLREDTKVQNSVED